MKHNSYKQLTSIILSISLVGAGTLSSFAQNCSLAVPGDAEIGSSPVAPVLINVGKSGTDAVSSVPIILGGMELYNERLELLRKAWPHFSPGLLSFLTSAFNSERILQVFLGFKSGYIIERNAKYAGDKDDFEDRIMNVVDRIQAGYYRLIRRLPVRMRRKLSMLAFDGEGGIDTTYSRKGEIALVRKFLSSKGIRRSHDIRIRLWKDKEGRKYTIVYSPSQLKAYAENFKGRLKINKPEDWLNSMDDYFQLKGLFCRMYPQDFSSFVAPNANAGRRLDCISTHGLGWALYEKSAPDNIIYFKQRNQLMNRAWLAIAGFEHEARGLRSEPDREQKEAFNKINDFTQMMLELERVFAENQKRMFSIKFEHLGCFEHGYSAPTEGEKQRWAAEMGGRLKKALEGVKPFISDEKIREDLNTLIKNLIGRSGEIQGLVEGLRKELEGYMERLPAPDFVRAFVDLGKAIIVYDAAELFIIKLSSILSHQVGLYNANVYSFDDLIKEYRRNLLHYTEKKKDEKEQEIKESSEWLNEWWQEIKDLKSKLALCKRERKESQKMILEASERLVQASEMIGLPADADWFAFKGQVAYRKNTGAVYRIEGDSRETVHPYNQYKIALVEPISIKYGEACGTKIDLVPTYGWPKDIAGFVRLFPNVDVRKNVSIVVRRRSQGENNSAFSPNRLIGGSN